MRFYGKIRFTVSTGLQTFNIGKETMPKYIIEREIPGAGNLSADELHSISQKSCGVLNSMGPHIQWVESSVTDDKIYCTYIAPHEDAIREHAEKRWVSGRPHF